MGDALATLPPLERSAVLLRFFEKRTFRDIGNTLGLTEEAARKRVARALQRLRKWMEARDIHCSDHVIRTSLSGFVMITLPEAHATALAQMSLEQGTSVGNTTALPSLLLPSVAVLLVSASLPLAFPPTAHDPITHLETAQPLTEAEPAPPPALSGLALAWHNLKDTHGPPVASFPTLYHAIQALDDGFRREAFFPMLIAEWSRADLSGTLDFFLVESPFETFMRAWKQCLRTDPEACVALVLQNPERFRNRLESILHTLIPVAPDTLASLAPRLGTTGVGGVGDSPISHLFSRFAREDLQHALAMADTFDGIVRKKALIGIAQERGQCEGQSAWEWGNSLEPLAFRNRVLAKVLEGWAISDPEAALAHAHDIPPGDGFRTVPQRVMITASSHHLDRVLDWLETQPPSAVDGVALAAHLLESPQITIARLQGHPHQEVLANDIGATLLNLGSTNARQLLDWIETQPDSTFLRKVRIPTLQGLGIHAPAEMLERALTLSKHHPITTSEVDRYTATLVSSDPGHWRFYLENSPKPFQESLMRTAAARLERIRISWIALEECLSFAAPDDRPAVMASIASARARAQPVSAMAWASTLPYEYQQEALTSIAESWAQNDPESCQHWLDTQSPADQVIQALTKALTK